MKSERPSTRTRTMARTLSMLQATFGKDLAGLIWAYHWDKSRDLYHRAQHGEWEACEVCTDGYQCSEIIRGAACGDHPDLVRIMIARCNNWTIRFVRDLAYRCGHLAIARMLIASGVTHHPDDALECACNGGHVAAIELAIEQGATCWNRGFHAACKGKHIDAVRMMIAHGALPDYIYVTDPEFIPVIDQATIVENGSS